jgi:hypothetical protein
MATQNKSPIWPWYYAEHRSSVFYVQLQCRHPTLSELGIIGISA